MWLSFGMSAVRNRSRFLKPIGHEAGKEELLGRLVVLCTRKISGIGVGADREPQDGVSEASNSRLKVPTARRFSFSQRSVSSILLLS